MKFIIRTFFKTLRRVLGPLMQLWELISRPKGLVRPAELQQQVDVDCRSLVLYQYQTCPFCIKVRQEMRRLSLPIERLDAQKIDSLPRAALLQGGARPRYLA